MTPISPQRTQDAGKEAFVARLAVRAVDLVVEILAARYRTGVVRRRDAGVRVHQCRLVAADRAQDVERTEVNAEAFAGRTGDVLDDLTNRGHDVDEIDHRVDAVAKDFDQAEHRDRILSQHLGHVRQQWNLEREELDQRIERLEDVVDLLDDRLEHAADVGAQVDEERAELQFTQLAHERIRIVEVRREAPIDFETRPEFRHALDADSRG